MFSPASLGALVSGAPGASSALAAWRGQIARGRTQLGVSFQVEIDERRLFLWVPILMGAGAILYLSADREASFGFSTALFALVAAIAFVVRSHALAFRFAIAIAAVCGGMFFGALRNARVEAPVLDRIRILKLSGFVEEIDFRREGARFVLRVVSAEGLAPAETPYRVRLTTRRTPEINAGAFVTMNARLVPPAKAALPGGYEFARDAWFARIGGVGNALGRIDTAEAPEAAPLKLRFYAGVDRARNALARRVENIIGGPAGAVGAAMVTGKRDFLDDPTRDVIREAGIFHIITIAGVQMTLVAGIFFIGFRRLLALSRTLALNYPIKKWAAVLAMAGAILYDISTGSRVGTERALYMTLIVLAAVLFERQAISMRNLAFATLAIIVFEPEALLGASFQLSFAAVAALLSAWEARLSAYAKLWRRDDDMLAQLRVDKKDRMLVFFDKTRHGPGNMLFSTVCATGATMSFMAYNFHEISPWVLIGNPLTLTIIEVFAVPGALVGALLYPLGLDAWVWQYIGLGIKFILWAAAWIAAMPGATIHLREFAPWAIIFLALAVLNAVVWRTWTFRLIAFPMLAIGIYGATTGPRFDVAIAPTGEAVAVRLKSGELGVIGRRPSPFVSEQWLRADADGRPARMAVAAMTGNKRAETLASFAPTNGDTSTPRCDATGCIATLIDGRVLALVFEAPAFAEDCARADIIVSSIIAPVGCGAEIVIDRARLDDAGAMTLRLDDDVIHVRRARGVDEDRPWSRAPRRIIARDANGAPAARPGQGPLPEFDEAGEGAPFR